jgi:hypothetical protein
MVEDADYEVTLLDSFGDGLFSNFTVYLGEESNDDMVLAYYEWSDNYFYSFTMNLTVSGDSIINVTTSGTFSPSPLTEPPTPWPTPSGPTLPVLFEVYTDSWPSETGFQVTLDGEVVYEVPAGTYTEPFTFYSTVIPMVEDADYEVTLLDSFGDGLFSNFTVYLGEEPDDDKVLAYFESFADSLWYNYTMNFTVSEGNIIHRTSAPSSAPVLQPPVLESPSSSCNVCGQGMAVTKPDAIFDNSSGLRCDEIEIAGQEGLIDEEVCLFLPELIDQVCGCA